MKGEKGVKGRQWGLKKKKVLKGERGESPPMKMVELMC